MLVAFLKAFYSQVNAAFCNHKTLNHKSVDSV
jgi:hypothetical protein